MIRPCLTCGSPSPGSYCPDHEPQRWHAPMHGSARSRGYSTAWDKLSPPARRLQPFCSDAQLSPCSGPLTTDHLPSAWPRQAECKPLRLADVDVVCQHHNERGSSRPGSQRARGGPVAPVATAPLDGAQTHGTAAVEGCQGPGGKPRSHVTLPASRLP